MSKPTVEEVIFHHREVARVRAEIAGKGADPAWMLEARLAKATADHLERLSCENKIMREALVAVSTSKYQSEERLILIATDALEKVQDK